MSEEADTIAKVIEESSEIPMDMPAFDPSKMPTREELLDMLDSMGLGDQEKEELRAALMAEDVISAPAASIFSSQFLILASFLLLIALIFGYYFIFYFTHSHVHTFFHSQILLF